MCSEYLITTKAHTVDSIVESAVLSMKMISHTTQGMQVSYNATTPSPNNQSFKHADSIACTLATATSTK